VDFPIENGDFFYQPENADFSWRFNQKKMVIFHGDLPSGNFMFFFPWDFDGM